MFERLTRVETDPVKIRRNGIAIRVTLAAASLACAGMSFKMWHNAGGLDERVDHYLEAVHEAGGTPDQEWVDEAKDVSGANMILGGGLMGLAGLTMHGALRGARPDGGQPHPDQTNVEIRI